MEESQHKSQAKRGNAKERRMSGKEEMKLRGKGMK